jgi:methionyl-tRNA formyltransferase
MHVVFITQDEPFFLAESFEYLLSRLRPPAIVSGAVLLSPSPFGKKETMRQKLLRSYRIFGALFVGHYIARYLGSKLRRAPTVANVMAQHGIPVIRLDAGINKPKSLEAIRALRPDVLVSVGGNEIFRRPLIDLAPKGCLNLHTALLPKYRGLMPSFWVLRFREQYTGVSVFLVDEGIDTGPILVQKRVAIGDMTQEELIRHCKKIGMDALAEALDMIAGDQPCLLPNDDADATYFSFPTTADVAAFREAGAKFF